MSYVGFDTPAVRRLAATLTATAPTALTMHNQVVGVLDRAAAVLPGLAVGSMAHLRPLGHGSYGPAPGGTAASLDDLAAEIGRRVAQLEACEALVAAGFDVDLSMVFTDTAPPSVEKVKAALDTLKSTSDWDPGTNGNRDDLRRVAGTVDGLSDAELDAFLQGADAADLKRLGSLMGDTGDSWWKPWDSNGLPVWERTDFTSRLLGRADPSVWTKVTNAFPGTQPGFDTTDAFLDGRNPQTGANGSGLHWVTPTGPMFRTDASGADVSPTDVSQGVFGDCWFISTVIATSGSHPDFVKDGVRTNPNGTVSVRLFDDDRAEHWVTVTPDLPATGHGDLAGARGVGDLRPASTELWPAYYEKAFAVAYQHDDGGGPDGHDDDPAYDRPERGSYGALEWDYNEHAPPYVTGMPSRKIALDLAEVQREFDSRHPVIVASNPNSDGVPEDQKSAYKTRHVYYIKRFDGNKVVLGNPWGLGNPDVIVDESTFSKIFHDPRALDVP